MKRTRLSSVVVLASLVVSTVSAPAFAGKGGGSGGHSFGGNAGKSMGSNFSSSAFKGPSNVGMKLNNNVGRVTTSQPFVQKLQTGNSIGLGSKLQTGNSSRILTKPVLNAQNGNQVSKNLGLNQIKNLGINKNLGIAGQIGKTQPISQRLNKSGQNLKCSPNWWCSNGSNSCNKFCGNGGCWWPGSFGCGYGGCYPWFGFCSYPCLNYNYGCGYGYGTFTNTIYVPQYIQPVTTVATTSVEAPTTIVQVEAAQPVQPIQAAAITKAAVEEKLPEMQLGGSYSLAGTFGTKAGQLFLEVGDVGLGVKVDTWEEGKVAFTLPMIGLAKPTDAKLHVISTEGSELKAAAVRLTMPTQMTAQK